jgi:integrase
MGGPTNKLTELSLKNAKPGPTTRRMSDGSGLFLEINKNGSKYWRMAYRFAGKQKLLAFGVYPSVSLIKAREAAQNAKKELAEGKDPGIIRKIDKLIGDRNDSFQFVAYEWLEKFKNQWSDTHLKSISGRLKLHVFPWIGDRPVGEITAPEMLSVLRRIEARGHLENAHRALTNSGQVFRYAIATGRAERNPCADLKGAIPPPSVKHMSSITDPKEVGELMRAISRYPGSTLTRCALQLTAYVFLRSKEIRFAEWSEIDFDKQEWHIPIKKMKGSKKDKDANLTAFHLVPLASQVINLLQEAHALSGKGKYVFPGLRSSDKPLSDATLTNALRRMGYTQEELHVHGLRATARTLIRQELGFDEEPIERQLAHAVKGPLGAAYNRANFIEERRKMMQAWADYLDSLKND